ncbi:hypothetical protein BH23BAC2_BH23BAC2_05080 [soil metagenome]
MVQHEIPVNEETYTIATFLSGMGLWLLIALALIGVLIYKKFKK